MFTFPVKSDDLFEERAAQMNAWGIPAATIREIRASIRETWAEGPGGWTWEWSQRALRAEEQGKYLLAAALHGGARFPVACTPDRQVALHKQIECFMKASPGFSVNLERRMVPMMGGDKRAVVPTHIYRPKTKRADLPVIVLSGGVDTYKVELHRLATILCRVVPARVAAIDMPGTGETAIPLDPNADRIYEQILDNVSEGSPCKRGVFGISFGGLWAAKLVLTGRVDAAIDLGGPVGSVPFDHEFSRNLPNGMTGIVANAMGLRALPSVDDIDRMFTAFSLREQGILDRPASPLPLLAINGCGDPYIPAEETFVFDGLNGAEAWLFEKGDHCAANMLPRLMPAMVAFLRLRLHGRTLANRTLDFAARALLPARRRPSALEST